MKDSFDARNCFKKNPSFVFRKIAGRFLLVPICQHAENIDNIFMIDEVGSFIWELLDGRRTISEIRNAVVNEFDVGDVQAESDLIEFLKQLKGIGALIGA